MAPIDKPDHNLVEQQIKDVIQDLFQVMVQVSTYDQAGKPSREVLSSELSTLSTSLRAVHRTAASSLPPNDNTSTSLPLIPDPLIEYVEAGRNPDIYTREMVELVRRMNQLARGKEMAFVRFRDVLAGEMGRAMPELAGDVDRVLEATGGREPIAGVVAEGGGGGGGREGEGGSGGEGEKK
ncbi:hypothetical protein CONLIGDRAFT_710993 [Coniochaeta ligniaria NRRL 30616]|uniref:Mediator of RNA polymerase II transcription subunit 10 n=1 Tax=Coniochaeta ligniaria NRRL 30616 TaxID=1408157 RepID=A0A1J7JSP0_9PEZI|nr:hypothetical protein CONLIGDRAFT_710993 [Coniochaeta ligniaria NRRL 30616]